MGWAMEINSYVVENSDGDTLGQICALWDPGWDEFVWPRVHDLHRIHITGGYIKNIYSA
jgi:hypothetical protein